MGLPSAVDHLEPVETASTSTAHLTTSEDTLQIITSSHFAAQMRSIIETSPFDRPLANYDGQPMDVELGVHTVQQQVRGLRNGMKSALEEHKARLLTNSNDSPPHHSLNHFFNNHSLDCADPSIQHSLPCTNLSNLDSLDSINHTDRTPCAEEACPGQRWNCPLPQPLETRYVNFNFNPENELDREIQLGKFTLR